MRTGWINGMVMVLQEPNPLNGVNTTQGADYIIFGQSNRHKGGKHNHTDITSIKHLYIGGSAFSLCK